MARKPDTRKGDRHVGPRNSPISIRPRQKDREWLDEYCRECGMRPQEVIRIAFEEYKARCIEAASNKAPATAPDANAPDANAQDDPGDLL